MRCGVHVVLHAWMCMVGMLFLLAPHGRHVELLNLGLCHCSVLHGDGEGSPATPVGATKQAIQVTAKAEGNWQKQCGAYDNKPNPTTIYVHR